MHMNSCPHNPDFYWPSRRMPLENILGKGENAFSPVLKMFSTLLKTTSIILAKFKLSSANAFNLNKSITSVYGKELMVSKSMHHYI